MSRKVRATWGRELEELRPWVLALIEGKADAFCAGKELRYAKRFQGETDADEVREFAGDYYRTDGLSFYGKDCAIYSKEWK